MLLLFFGTVAGVNALMIYFALSTFRGEVDASPYEHGLAYDRDIAAAHAQDERHWRVEGRLTRLVAGEPARLEVVMRDAADQPLTGLQVRAALQFATDKAHDRNVALSETASGVYAAPAAIPAGRWTLVVEARRGTDLMFRSQSRLQLQ